MTTAGLVNLVTVLGIVCAILAVALIVAVMLLVEQVGERRASEGRLSLLRGQLANANRRIHRLLTRPAPERTPPDAAETQQLPRYPQPPTYKPAVAAAPGTALVPAPHAQLPMPVPPRVPARTR